ncbi:HdeD family acid-resistance protein [Polymorphobacter fuscus]|uniref:HdeD family acid-resistance protein n=1 Tax=Sandarakinorhabdus fusca TaxID=1439888 RepID=A0A7C9GN07_9SPHN|nr:DUF308 domain-containing protein [Polymorphobacter fuscus]KAB7648849.1 HdeD family acid-resistance protein [Polymorphobacter fuscus]MQT16432.1 HdeD family acid-resistance protein [Polymorphobacter fuscus]NJC07278.1 uncharacterized membrane protein HdeD (DUF308 family) [Polymorphobacter fuscus]
MAANWGWVALRGVLGIVIGVLALAFPMATVGALVLLFAIYSIMDGVAAIIAAVRAFRRDRSWGWLAFQGVISLGAAAVALLMPLIAVKVFIFVMAFWAILGGIALAIAAFNLPLDHGRWWLAIGGVLSILWGVLLLMQPVIGALVLALWFGVYTLVFGILFAVLGFTLRGRHKQRLAAA